MRLLLSILTALSVLVLGSMLAAAQPAAIDIRGNISTPFNTTGVVVDVLTGSNSAPNITFTVGTQDKTGYGSSSSAGTYSITVNCNNDSTIFLRVWGINGTAVGCVYGQTLRTNITAALVANGASCRYANACSSGICCSGSSAINSSTGSGTCSASACSSGTTTSTGGGGSSGGGGGGGGGTTTPALAAPSQETVDVVKDALPATFQVAADAGNVEYKTVSAPEVKEVPVAVEAVTKIIEQLQTTAAVQSEEAKQAVAEIQQAISSSGGGATVSVKKTIEVVKATNKVTGESVTVSVVKLSVTAPADKALKNVEVVEVIPKAVANNVNQVTFKGEKPVVLQADPVVKWAFAEVLRGQTKDLSYAINKDISNLNTNTLAVSKKAEEAAPPAPEAPAPEAGKPGEAKKPTPVNTMVLVVVLAVIVIGGWLFLKSRKKVMK